MNSKKAIEEILKRYNAGDIKGARNHFMLSQWFLSEKTREYFLKKFNMYISKEAKKACDYMGWKIVNDNFKTIYKSKKYDRNH